MKELMHVLNLLPDPIFFCRDGVVVACNEACANLGLQEGDVPELDPAHLNSEDELQFSGQLNGKPWDIAMQTTAHGRMVTLHPPVFPLLTGMLRGLLDPLVSLQTAAHDLFPVLEEVEDEFYQGKTAAMSRSLFRLMRLKNNLDIANRLATGAVPPLFEKTDVTAFFSDLLLRSKDALCDAGIELEYKLPKKNFKGNIDRQLVQHAVLGLLSNAAEHSSKGTSISLQIRFHGSVPGTRRMEIRVENQGQAIEAQTFSTMFSRFFGTAAEDAAKGGAGLGLYLAQTIARAHGGTVMMENHDGRTITSLLLDLDTTASDLNTPRVDMFGPYDPVLLEFSGLLPDSTYDTQNVDI